MSSIFCKITPRVGFSRREISLKSVVLPQPFSPRSTALEPFNISNETPFNISRSFTENATSESENTGKVPLNSGHISSISVDCSFRYISLSAISVTLLFPTWKTLSTNGKTTSSLCSITIIQYPAFARDFNVDISISAPAVSRFASGSSKMTIFCPIASVEAVISLCFCPPDSLRLCHDLSSFIRRQTVSICLLIFSGENARFSHPKEISSSTVFWIICSSAFCKTTPTFRQTSPRRLPFISSPFINTSPDSLPSIIFGIMPLMIYKSVLFPSPEYPETRFTSPELSAIFTFSNI